MEEDELIDQLAEMLEEWQVDALIELIRKKPAWVAIGKDPMVGDMGEPPPVASWRLN